MDHVSVYVCVYKSYGFLLINVLQWISCVRIRRGSGCKVDGNTEPCAACTTYTNLAEVQTRVVGWSHLNYSVQYSSI